MAAVAITGVISLGLAGLYSSNIKTQKQNSTRYWMSVRRAQVRNYIRSQSSLASIVALNPNMNCLQANTSCSAYQNAQALKLNIDGSMLDGSLPQLGMNSQGDFCSDYGNSQSNCDLGISLTWRVVCDSPTCKAGQLRVDMQFQHDSINAQTAKLVVYRDPLMQDMSEVCEDFGGTLTGNTCSLPQLSSSCNVAAKMYPLGFDNAGNLICGSPSIGSCSGSDSILGFNASGGLICGSACL